MDIDNFKQCNDTYGHMVGDKVLSCLGKVVRECLRKTDSAYRYGGEEFIVILPETKGEDAVNVAERIRKGFEAEILSPRPNKPL
jgi:diguanylate cyclase (GGDEF)-like protein